jgi:Anaphase-promoting complex subunit 4 WD40 domain
VSVHCCCRGVCRPKVARDGSAQCTGCPHTLQAAPALQARSCIVYHAICHPPYYSCKHSHAPVTHSPRHSAPRAPHAPPCAATARLQASMTVSDNSSEIFCVRFSPDGKFLAAGCGDGAVRVFSVATGRLAYNLQVGIRPRRRCMTRLVQRGGSQRRQRRLQRSGSGSGSAAAQSQRSAGAAAAGQRWSAPDNAELATTAAWPEQAVATASAHTHAHTHARFLPDTHAHTLKHAQAGSASALPYCIHTLALTHTLSHKHTNTHAHTQTQHVHARSRTSRRHRPAAPARSPARRCT